MFRGWTLLKVDPGLQPYRSYLPSGADYFETAPSHWLVVPGMLAMTENHRDNKGMKESKVLSLSYGRIVVKAEEKLVGLVPESFETYQIVMPGDIIIRCTDLQNDKSSLRSGLVKDRGIITSAYICLSAKQGFDFRYLHYLLHLLDISKAIYKLGSGLRQNLSFDDFKRLPVLRPPYSEQRLIADYLDNKSAQIDQAIRIKERQIELLKERKQILIQQTITRGLDSGASMRDSGVEWIGEVPAHWELKKIRYLGTTQNGISAGAEFFGHGYPFVSYSDVYNNEQLPESVSGLANASVSERSQYSVECGDVLFTRTSETAEEIGFASTCFKTIANATFAGFLIRFRPKTNTLLQDYSKYYFNSPMLRAYFVKEMSIVTRASLSQQLLKNMPVLLPPNKEQIEIHIFLERESAKFEKAINIQARQIKKLKEYKATLVDSAVTGKIKVPGIVEPQVQKLGMP
jgi:type I restriction enzyme S subunit